MAYTAKNYDHLLGMDGFSDQLLRNHFTLYHGYVTNANALTEALRELGKAGKAGTLEYAELKRRFGWEFNGMRLHELYFDNLTRTSEPLEADAPLARLIREQYGSFEAWRDDFKAVGAMRRIGWVVLYHDPVSGRLFNVWINEHDLGHLAGCTPLLIMDVFEHAYMLDYGLKKAAYIEAFFQNINWRVVAARLK